jgi:hypothetical protein
MQNEKTHFEQVPMEVAESALRLQPRRPKPIARGRLFLRSYVPTRAGRRRFLRLIRCRWFPSGSADFHPGEKSPEKSGK